MEAIVIKSKIKHLIDIQDDEHILNAIYTLLSKTSTESIFKTKLSQRAQKAEQDIESGKVYDFQEVLHELGKTTS